jgi:glycerophosphoryl diester phosphodiesterase
MKNLDWLFKTPIAHRGLHNESVAENSYTAFAAAIDKGYSIETDVHFSADGKLVVFHDFTLKRLCGVDRKITSMTVSELKQLRLMNTQDTIMTLDELLKLVDGKVGLLIEIKFRMQSIYKKISEEVYKAIKDYKGNVAIQSFSPSVVRWFKDNAPEIPRGMLASGYQNLNIPQLMKKGMRLLNRLFGAKIVKMTEPDFIAYNILSFPNPRLQALKEKGMPFLTWTVNKKELLTSAQEYADNIIFENIEVINI